MFRSKLIGTALVTAALASACGAGGSTQSGTATWTCAPGVTDDEITVGVLYPDSGAMSAQYTGYRSGVEARMAEQNAAGGVGGRRITTIWRDDESSPGVNLRAAKDLVTAGAFAILEHTAYSEQSAPWLDQQHIPVVGVADQPLWADHPNMFTYTYVADDAEATTTLGQFVQSRGGTRAALIITSATRASLLYAESARRSLAAAGIPVVFEEPIDGITMPEVVGRIVRTGADTLVAATSLDIYIGALITAAEQGHPFGTAVSPAGYDMRVLASGLRQALAGTYTPLPFTALERGLPAHRDYLSAMTRHAPEIQPPSQQSAVNGWISADLFLRGLRTQGHCPTRDSYIRGLRAVTDYDAGGLLTQKINFSAGQGQLDRCADFVRVSATGDVFEVVEPQPRCGELVPAAPAVTAATAAAQDGAGRSGHLLT